MRFSRKVLIPMLIFLLYYTLSSQYILATTGYESAVLTTGVFAFCGGQSGIMGWIEVTKIKKKKLLNTLFKKESENEEDCN